MSARRRTGKPRRRQQPISRRRSRRPLLLGVLLAVVLAGGGTAAGLLLGTGGPGTPAPILARPLAYQIVYRVTATATGTAVTTWQVLTVHRPYDSSDITYGADPAENPGPPRSATWFDITTLYTLDGAGVVRRVSDRQPGLAGSDQALGVELDALVRRGLAKSTGRSEVVAGRSCRVFRFVEPPVGPIKPLSSSSDSDDVCLDASGLELAERYTISGRLAYQRQAVRVTVGNVTDPMSAAHAQPLPGGGTHATTVPGVDGSVPIATPPTPAGYQAAKPVIFTLPAPTGQGLAARSTVWVFSRGADVISVEAGTEAAGHYPWDGQQTRTEAVHLAGLGSARTALTSEGPQVQVSLGGGHWVRVTGTVRLSVLLSFAQRLSRAH